MTSPPVLAHGHLWWADGALRIAISLTMLVVVFALTVNLIGHFDGISDRGVIMDPTMWALLVAAALTRCLTAISCRSTPLMRALAYLTAGGCFTVVALECLLRPELNAAGLAVGIVLAAEAGRLAVSLFLVEMEPMLLSIAARSIAAIFLCLALMPFLIVNDESIVWSCAAATLVLAVAAVQLVRIVARELWPQLRTLGFGLRLCLGMLGGLLTILAASFLAMAAVGA